MKVSSWLRSHYATILPGLRILFDYRPALVRPSGVGEAAHKLASALVPQLGPADVLTIFSSSWRDRLGPGRVAGAKVADARVPVRILNFAWHRLGWPPVEWLAGPADVVHAQHPLLIPARRAARVVTIYDLYFLDHPERTRAEIRRDYAALAPSHAPRADAVIVASAHMRSLVASRLGVPRNRVWVCPLGAPDWSPRGDIVPSGPVLFMGTLEPRKNVGGLLDAYARLLARRPDAPRLRLAGHVPEDGRATLGRIDAAPFRGRVEHAGYVRGEDRARLYREASVLVLPSFDEGFGLPVLEAMTVGVPVVASRRGALPELVGDAGLLVDPADPEDLARGLDRLLGDPALQRRLAEAGRRRAAGYSWASTASRVLDVYRAAIERRGAR